MPKEDDVIEVDPALLEEEEQKFPERKNNFASCSERSYILTALIGLIGLTYLVYHFATKGFALDLNIVNTIFIILGIIFHGTPQRFLAATQNAIKKQWNRVPIPFLCRNYGNDDSFGLSRSIFEVVHCDFK